MANPAREAPLAGTGLVRQYKPQKNAGQTTTCHPTQDEKPLGISTHGKQQSGFEKLLGTKSAKAPVRPHRHAETS
ncbi:hypothetical protein BGP82_23480 [Pseudomonas putida]|uniref:Uncharacterized protein n=1 Tax=Pseudomonas putida TaxID=303 RepID=A0A2S3WS53_PSEPU|nr:hypothetical protein BGP82_23480 [Pseudomonas putida]